MTLELVRRRAAATGAAPMLEVEGLTKRFGGLVAVRDMRLAIRPGEIVGLIGPNGAGKTTLFNVITGLVQEQGGHVRLGDIDLTDASSVQVARAGLARTFQNLRLFKNLSVRENVELAALVAGRHRGHRPAVDVDALLDDDYRTINPDGKVRTKADVLAGIRARGGKPGRAAEVAGHLKAFWEPRMLRALQAHVEAGGAGLSPLAREAADLLGTA